MLTFADLMLAVGLLLAPIAIVLGLMLAVALLFLV